MDPYILLTVRSQEKKSGVATGKGTELEWNETFLFTISEGVEELSIKLLDSDTRLNDDLVGEVSIPLEALFAEGSIPETRERGYGKEEESYRGWKQSSY